MSRNGTVTALPDHGGSSGSELRAVLNFYIHRQYQQLDLNRSQATKQTNKIVVGACPPRNGSAGNCTSRHQCLRRLARARPPNEKGRHKVMLQDVWVYITRTSSRSLLNSVMYLKRWNVVGCAYFRDKGTKYMERKRPTSFGPQAKLKR